MTPDHDTSPVGSGRIRAASAIALGLALALAGGLLEAAYRAGGEPLSTRLPRFGIEFFWVVPAGMLVLSLPVILLAAAGRALRPTTVSVQRAAATMALPSLLALSLAILRERMPDGVHVVLALGLASVIARMAEGSAARLQRAAACALPVLLLAPVAAFLATGPGRDRLERQRVAALPRPTGAARNVLLIVWDTVRERELSLYGYRLPTTPNLSRLAATGVVFDRAYSAAPWTLASHASIFTGKYPQDLEVDWVTPLGGGHPLLAEAFDSVGYRTGGFTANLGATQRPTGLARGFLHYEDFVLRLRPAVVVAHTTLAATLKRYRPFRHARWFQLEWKDAPTVSDSFLRWLDGSPGRDRPFFAFLNYFNAHGPYRAPAAYRRRFPGDTAQARYDAAIAYQDAELDRLFRELETRGLLANTVIVFTSDHGEGFGDHGYWGHGGVLYAEQVHVPLVIWGPGDLPRGTRIAQPVSLRDLAATMLDLAGTPRAGRGLGGSSLTRAWRSAAAPAEPMVVGANYAPHERGAQTEHGAGNALVVDRLHYILTGDGTEQLFDAVADPSELHDLAAVDSLGTVLRDARRFLLDHFSPPWTLPVQKAEAAGH